MLFNAILMESRVSFRISSDLCVDFQIFGLRREAGRGGSHRGICWTMMMMMVSVREIERDEEQVSKCSSACQKEKPSCIDFLLSSGVRLPPHRPNVIKLLTDSSDVAGAEF